MAQEPQDNIEELLPGYALNALEPEEQALVERALEREPRYQAMLADYLEGVGALAVSHALAVPSAALRERVLGSGPAGVTSSTASSESDRPNGLPPAFWGMAAVLVVAMLGLGSFAVFQQRQVRDLEDGMDSLVAEAENTEEVLQDQLELTSLAVQPGVSRASMTAVATPAPPQGPARGTLFNRPDGALILWAVNLEPLNEDAVYQAWLWESPDDVYSLATFEVDENGQALVPMWVPTVTKGNRWMSISVEQAGGALTPVGERVLVGVFDEAAP